MEWLKRCGSKWTAFKDILQKEKERQSDLEKRRILVSPAYEELLQDEKKYETYTQLFHKKLKWKSIGFAALATVGLKLGLSEDVFNTCFGMMGAFMASITLILMTVNLTLQSGNFVENLLSMKDRQWKDLAESQSERKISPIAKLGRMMAPSLVVILGVFALLLIPIILVLGGVELVSLTRSGVIDLSSMGVSALASLAAFGVLFVTFYGWALMLTEGHVEKALQLSSCNDRAQYKKLLQMRMGEPLTSSEVNASIKKNMLEKAKRKMQFSKLL